MQHRNKASRWPIKHKSVAECVLTCARIDFGIPRWRVTCPLIYRRVNFNRGVVIMSQELHAMIAGETVTIRPIRMTDVGMEGDFVRHLSPESKHFRFLGGVSELPADELRRLCDVDGNHTMAFVATVRREDREVEIGVSRYAQNSEADVREIAVTVADEWQHKGLGGVLMRRLIEAAKINGVRQLYSIDLASNTAMAALARELGMRSVRDPSDSNQLIYSLAL